jgi:hypothetical protein
MAAPAGLWLVPSDGDALTAGTVQH